MALKDLFKLFDVIRWEDANPDCFAWKHPAESFNTQSQLIVEDSQVAVFRACTKRVISVFSGPVFYS